MKKSVSGLIGGAVMALLIQNHASADDATRLQVDYNIGDYHGYNASDYIVDLHGSLPLFLQRRDICHGIRCELCRWATASRWKQQLICQLLYVCKSGFVPTGYWKAMACSDVNTSQLGYSFGISSLNRAANLYNAYVNTVNFGSQSGEINGGALQLAIWDVLNGNNMTSISDRSSLFCVSAVGRESGGNRPGKCISGFVRK